MGNGLTDKQLDAATELFRIALANPEQAVRMFRNLEGALMERGLEQDEINGLFDYLETAGKDVAQPLGAVWM